MVQQQQTEAEKTTGRRDKPPQSDMTVRDCFRWDTGDQSSSGNGTQQHQYQHKFLIKKGEVGKQRDVGYRIPTPPPPKNRDTTENAGNALRGWPELKCHKKHESDYNPAPKSTDDRCQNNEMKQIMEQQSVNDCNAEDVPKLDTSDSKDGDGSQCSKKKTKKVGKTPRQGKEFDNTIEGRRPWRPN